MEELMEAQSMKREEAENRNYFRENREVNKEKNWEKGMSTDTSESVTPGSMMSRVIGIDLFQFT